MRDIQSILQQDVNQEQFNNVLSELKNAVSEISKNTTPFSSPRNARIENLILKQREKTTLKRNGKQFSSVAHMNGAVDKQSEIDTFQALEKFTENGYDYIVSGKLFYDKVHRRFTREKLPNDTDPIYVTFNIIDKIKVRSLLLQCAAISHQFSMTGTNGVCSKNLRNFCDMFLQEVANSSSPAATWARYRTIENMLARAISPNDVSVNTINVNMSRGIHEHILLLRLIACHNQLNNPESRIIPLINHFKLNNNSVTIDSVISCIQNEISFLPKCTNNKGNLSIQTKSEFKTHKYLTVLNKDSKFNTYHKETDTRKSLPVKGLEIQVHQRSLNCSAISGPQLLNIVGEIIASLLNDAIETGKITIDICLVNAKALCEKLSNSLIIPCMNDFCELLCRHLKSHTMTIQEQMHLFENKVAPILRKIFMTRDNYAMAGTFSTVIPLGNKLLSTSDNNILSHKYNEKETYELFEVLTKEEIEAIPKLSEFMKKVKKYKENDIYLHKTLKPPKKTANKKYIKKKRKRTAGITYNVSFGTKKYINALQKYNIDLPEAKEV